MYYSKTEAGYVLRIEVGEEIQESLRQFSESLNLKGAFYQGIGAIDQVELAYFCIDTKNYERKFLDGSYELITLLGNISFADGALLPHSHVTLGSRNFETVSGHLVRGTVSVTTELLLTPVEIQMTRKEDPLLKYKGLITEDRIHLQIES